MHLAVSVLLARLCLNARTWSPASHISERVKHQVSGTMEGRNPYIRLLRPDQAGGLLGLGGAGDEGVARGEQPRIVGRASDHDELQGQPTARRIPRAGEEDLVALLDPDPPTMQARKRRPCHRGFWG
jgi:hypothetical protein